MSSQPEPQVDASLHYDPVKYLSPARMASIGYQVQFASKYFPASSVLEVGVGAGLTTDLLRQAGHGVQTLDVDPDLKPDLCGSILDIPSGEAEFGAVVCCQVLEHLPWEDVDQALSEIHRVCSEGVVLSVPTNRPTWMLVRFSARKWGHRRFNERHRANQPLRVRDGQHFWELESNQSTEDFRRKLLRVGFKIEFEEQPLENLFHHFFVLKKTILAGGGSQLS